MPTVTIGERPGCDFSGSEDAQLVQINPTTNDASGGVTQCSTFGASDRRFSWLKFSGLSNITGPVTVSSATLRLVCNSSSAGPRNLQLKRCLRDVVEAEATWNIYATGNSWTSGGGLSDGNDRSSTVSATQSLGSTGVQTISTAQLAQDVQDWINGVNPNYGWHMGLDTETGGDSKFWQWRSTESTSGTPTGDDRPQLTVVYTEGSGGVVIPRRSMRIWQRP
jgi:hypothetical protein